MRQRVAEARVGRLATVTSSAAPHIVPCCFALSDGVVYSAVDAKPKSTLALRRLANIEANPNVSLLVDHYAEDWSTLWWVRVDGRARLLDGSTDDVHERDDALVLLTAKYEQYRDSPPPGAVIALDITGWRSWP
jgi:PPOX class probable F420-dependent enzyme